MILDVRAGRSLLNSLVISDFSFLTAKEAERRNWSSPGNRGGGRSERNKTKTRITAPHCLQLILPPLHTKKHLAAFSGTAQHFQALPHTQG